MNYTTSLDWIAKGVTITVTLLFAAIFMAGFDFFNMPGQNVGPGALSIISILLIAVYGFCLAQWPRGYSVSKEALVIHKFVGKRVVALKDIKEVFFVKPEALRWSLRTFGSGGLFGYFGKFYNGTYGDMTWYATRVSHFVMVELKDGRHLVITPDQEGLEGEIMKQLPDVGSVE
jgi:hypothetical protein